MKWYIIWTGWILVAIASFAGFEAWALWGNGLTLSAYIWQGAAAWPPLGVVFGLVIGFLLCHFFWPNQGLLSSVIRMIKGQLKK